MSLYCHWQTSRTSVSCPLWQFNTNWCWQHFNLKTLRLEEIGKFLCSPLQNPSQAVKWKLTDYYKTKTLRFLSHNQWQHATKSQFYYFHHCHNVIRPETTYNLWRIHPLRYRKAETFHWKPGNTDSVIYEEKWHCTQLINLRIMKKIKSITQQTRWKLMSNIKLCRSWLFLLDSWNNHFLWTLGIREWLPNVRW